MVIKMTKIRNRGFTLIEVLIAIAVLAIALLALVSVTVSVINSNMFSRMTTTAITLAADKVEELKNIPYANLTSGGPQNLTEGNYTYTRKWQVLPDTGMKTITVTVTWRWRGQSHIASLSTILSER